MLTLKDKFDLDRLMADDIQESLTLDYKDAAALGKSNAQRNELCKDVSAFANSAGGQIIYGIQENGHHPTRAQETDAVNTAEITREWIEQVIDSNVQPRMKGLRIHPIDVAPGRVVYVITIPQATTNAPHQAPDNKYYYRQNFQSVPMEDYQVRDIMRRATTPELFIRLAFASGTTALIEYAAQTEMSADSGPSRTVIPAHCGQRSGDCGQFLMSVRGELYLVNFDSTIGSEMQKTRPALIIQNDIANAHSPVTIVAAITTYNGGKLYPTEVQIEAPPEA
jgi:Putative DNA-binding domain/PemK-like, MazF-like toxin of type II toxin-antitoxin system